MEQQQKSDTQAEPVVGGGDTEDATEEATGTKSREKYQTDDEPESKRQQLGVESDHANDAVNNNNATTREMFGNKPSWPNNMIVILLTCIFCMGCIFWEVNIPQKQIA